MNPITAGGFQPTNLTSPALRVGNAPDAGQFKGMLVDSIQSVNSMQSQADQAVETLFTGGDVNPAEVLTAVQKADLAFRLTMQMRNKAMEVYQEIKDIRI
ncbi:flagellar hook-basal body protein FliE [Posidoniimonas polymericola]|uniref:Flagellar hook-basal body complex protein FliE n=1 Tax=Posidoniimonas polymericola TaxID=2528002 RepID=A0A5C5YQM3_9BACT|nr:flagellar hook-basal body complex protein FliE [Posidoniimonas polymericola]TWT77215.1 flagellar hook-basal body protein FliE [Posidoniimonas polymericola]